MQIVIQTHDAQTIRFDLANVKAIVIEDGITPLLDVRCDTDGPTVVIQAVRPEMGLTVKPLAEHRVAVALDPARRA